MQELQTSSCIDNAYVSLEARACIKILDDAITDHYLLFITLEMILTVKFNKLKSIWRCNTSNIKASHFEAALSSLDWSSIYESSDVNTILDTILDNVNSCLDIIAPLKEIKFRED